MMKGMHEEKCSARRGVIRVRGILDRDPRRARRDKRGRGEQCGGGEQANGAHRDLLVRGVGCEVRGLMGCPRTTHREPRTYFVASLTFPLKLLIETRAPPIPLEVASSIPRPSRPA